MKLLVAAMIAAAQPLAAAADQWALDAATSEIVFSYTFFGKEKSGTFTRFGGVIEHAADRPEEASARFWAETASIDLDSALQEAAARSRAGFASEQHMLARFDFDEITPLGDGLYRARGIAAIKGRERDVEAEIRVDLGTDQVTAEGVLVVDRRDFDIGTGPLMALVDLGDQVAIAFNLIAHPVGVTTPQAQQEELQ